MRLPFDADQEQFNAWREYHMGRITDPVDEVDINDAMYVFAAARLLVQSHMDLLPRFIEVGPECVEQAQNELGMYMGISNFAKRVGLTPQEGMDALTKIVTGRDPVPGRTSPA